LLVASVCWVPVMSVNRALRNGKLSKLKFRKGPKARDSRRMVHILWGNSQVF